MMQNLEVSLGLYYSYLFILYPNNTFYCLAEFILFSWRLDILMQNCLHGKKTENESLSGGFLFVLVL